ncbi:sugar ABC transporter substrate-binding protein [Sporosarcina sp. FSL K6-1522]|uniref:sugar ABC transporter substrate-binding protein n=1 Tax=Sporosarcina sp. FSL K6-1522 TaxID=2921554 RepID=UPI00315AC052
MEKKQLITMLVSCVAVLLFLVGCSKGAAEGNKKDNGTDNSGKPKVAVVLKGINQEYFKLAEAGAKQAFEDFDVDGTFLAAASEVEAEKLINILEDQLNANPDALVVMPSTESTIPVLKRYQEKDIPVLLIDTDLDWDGKTTYIGTDNYTAGREAGKYLASQLSKGDEIAILEGVSGTAVSEDRIKGVKDVMKELGIKVVISQAADFDRVKAVTVMENIVTAHPNIKGVFTANDEMAMGALKTIESKKNNIVIVGIDGTSDALESISKGGVTGTVEQKPYDMGYIGVETALKAINKENVEKRIDSGVEIITIENAGDKSTEINKILGK